MYAKLQKVAVKITGALNEESGFGNYDTHWKVFWRKTKQNDKFIKNYMGQV